MAIATPAEQALEIKRKLYRTDYSAVGRILPAYQEQLAEDDVDFYRRNGYLAMAGLFTTDEVDEYKVALSDVLHQRVPWEGKLFVQEEPFYAEGGSEDQVTDPELRIRKVFHFVQIEPRLKGAAFHQKLVGLVDQLIGPGHCLTQDMALVKPPYHGSEKPWHQDTAYFDWLPLGGIIGAWIALDEATVQNGCMQVIPKSHLAGPVPHYHIRDCQMGDEGVQVEQAVVVPLKPGGVLFFSGLIHHGTPPNVSGDRRRALQFHYAAANCRKMTFAEHAELFNEGGAYAGCRKWEPESGIPRAVYSP